MTGRRPMTRKQFHELVHSCHRRTAGWDYYAGIQYHTLAAACGVDARTWRRWVVEAPADTTNARMAHVAAVLRGWLVLTENQQHGLAGEAIIKDAERLRRWKADPSTLTLACLAAAHPQLQQLELST